MVRTIFRSKKKGEGNEKLDTETSLGLPHETIAKALRVHSANLRDTAQALGISYQSLVRVIRHSKYLQKVQSEIVDLNLDKAESKLMSKIEEGNMTAIIFYLKCKGKHRGWVDRVELAGVPKKPIKIKVGVI